MGRGGAHGHYCGSGVPKGRHRSTNILPVVRGLLKKYPKLRGYKFKALSEKPAVLDLDIFDPAQGADNPDGTSSHQTPSFSLGPQ